MKTRARPETKLSWTKKKPEVAGFYWYAESAESAERDILYIKYEPHFQQWEVIEGGTGINLDEFNGYFYGPIHAPAFPKKTA
jgi:hypothetical protein